MNESDLLEEIFKIYTPLDSFGKPEYRAYYDNNDIICFSTEHLSYRYIKIDKEIFDTNRPDLFYIEDGKIQKKHKHYQNKLQLKPYGSTFATVKNDMQWLVDRAWPHEKSFWDTNV